MDAYDATRIVFSRIQNLDPENASKIMGFLLIQDHGEKEMIRLALGPETFLHSVVVKARKEMGLSSNGPSTPSTPSSPSPFLPNSNSISLSRQNSSSSSASSWLASGGGRGGGVNIPSPLSIPNPSSSTTSWAASCFSDFQNPEDLISPNSSTASYAAATCNGISSLAVGTSSSSMNSSASPFYGSGGTDLIDEFQLQDQLSFLNDGSPSIGHKTHDFFYPQPDLASSPGGNGGDSVLFPSYGGGASWAGSVNGLPHRRSCSVNDICLGSDDPAGGLGWKPCLYFARGYCKNGSSCRFLHDGLGDGDGAAVVGSPSKLEMMEQCQELLRSKSAHQQRFSAASQLISSGGFPYPPATANKWMSLLQQQQSDSQRAAAALMMGEDMHKFGRSRLERNDFSMNAGVGMVNSSSRQIYLTFPADSTFREDDVSNYFSIYGPVQDVRIPYQQKRMFGFVTFVYPETVKLILAKGNPHFVCDARVLVKPYKEKGKVPDKYRKQQQMERGEFSACGSPTGLDSRDPYDLQLGARMIYNNQQMLWKKKLEEQALEMQGRKLMSLQLLDVKRQNHHRTLSAGTAIPSPTHSPNFFNQPLVLPTDRSSPEALEDNVKMSSTAVGDQQQQNANGTEKEKEPSTGNDENDNGKESPHNEESDLRESLEHNLPDSPFASPKASGDYLAAFSNAVGEAPFPATSAANGNLITSSLLPPTSTLDMANSFKSCYFQLPRFSSGQGAIGM